MVPPTGAPRSRRERPAKPALSREAIVDVALTILREEGLAKVTMRRIAAALDTGPASLYVYVSDTKDLHAQVLDRLLAEVDVTAARSRRGAWRPKLHRLLDAYVAVLLRHPEIARMALSTLPTGPHHLAIVDALAGLLLAGGASDRAAAWGVDLLLQVATATAVEHGGEAPDVTAAGLDAVAGAVASAAPGAYPHLDRVGPLLTSGGGERLPWAFDVVVDGILAADR